MRSTALLLKPFNLWMGTVYGIFPTLDEEDGLACCKFQATSYQTHPWTYLWSATDRAADCVEHLLLHRKFQQIHWKAKSIHGRWVRSLYEPASPGRLGECDKRTNACPLKNMSSTLNYSKPDRPVLFESTANFPVCQICRRWMIVTFNLHTEGVFGADFWVPNFLHGHPANVRHGKPTNVTCIQVSRTLKSMTKKCQCRL